MAWKVGSPEAAVSSKHSDDWVNSNIAIWWRCLGLGETIRGWFDMRREMVIGLALSFLLGCSVGRTPIKKYVNDPPTSIGATRDEIERVLGSPDSSVNNPDGTKTDTYEFREGGLTPLSRVVMGIVSGGMTEVAWLLLPQNTAGVKRHFTVTYDSTDKAIAAVASETWQECLERERGADPNANYGDLMEKCESLEVWNPPEGIGFGGGFTGFSGGFSIGTIPSFR